MAVYKLRHPDSSVRIIDICTGHTNEQLAGEHVGHVGLERARVLVERDARRQANREKVGQHANSVAAGAYKQHDEMLNEVK